MAITTDKTWETKGVVVYNDVGTYHVENQHLLFGMKQALLALTVPAIVRLSATNVASSNNPTKTVTGASKANPCQITIVGHGFATGERVRLSGLGGMVELNDLDYTITVTGTDTFTLDGVDSTLYTTYTSGGSCQYQDNIDRWLTVADVIYGMGNHSWIVLEFPNVSPNGHFQVLLDWDVSYSYNMYMYISPSGSFFGGTSSVRPTASDEKAIMSNATWSSAADATTRTAYVCASTDGQCIRMHHGYNRLQNGCWAFERVKNPYAGWTEPWMVWSANGANYPTAWWFFDNYVVHSKADLSDPSVYTTHKMSTLCYDTTEPCRESLGGYGQDYNSEYYVQPISMPHLVAGQAKVMGEMFDFWVMTAYGEQWNYLIGHDAWTRVKVGDGFCQPAQKNVPWWRV